MYEITNSDWKKYREKIGIWQENYMERLLKEYVIKDLHNIIEQEGFWNE